MSDNVIIINPTLAVTWPRRRLRYVDLSRTGPPTHTPLYGWVFRVRDATQVAVINRRTAPKRRYERVDIVIILARFRNRCRFYFEQFSKPCSFSKRSFRKNRRHILIFKRTSIRVFDLLPRGVPPYTHIVVTHARCNSFTSLLCGKVRAVPSGERGGAVGESALGGKSCNTF